MLRSERNIFNASFFYRILSKYCALTAICWVIWLHYIFINRCCADNLTTENVTFWFCLSARDLVLLFLPPKNHVVISSSLSFLLVAKDLFTFYFLISLLSSIIVQSFLLSKILAYCTVNQIILSILKRLTLLTSWKQHTEMFIWPKINWKFSYALGLCASFLLVWEPYAFCSWCSAKGVVENSKGTPGGNRNNPPSNYSAIHMLNGTKDRQFSHLNFIVIILLSTRLLPARYFCVCYI